MLNHKAKRDAALLVMADEAIAQYNQCYEAGGESPYPVWAPALKELLSEVELLRGQVIPHVIH